MPPSTHAVARGVVDRQRQARRLFWLFLPETSIARSGRFQALLGSTFLSDGGRDALKYGALVAVTRSSDSTIQPALVGAVSLLPPMLLGMYGGAVADALPKRVALAAVYSVQAALCFIVPIFFGTGLGAVCLLIFGVNVLGQVSGPDEQSIAPLVASDHQLASATSLLSFASSVGTFFGTALLAPILLRVAGVRAVFAVAGIMLFLATVRVLRVRSQRDVRRGGYRRPSVRLRSLIAWLTSEPAVALMILVGVLAGTANVVLQTLGPRYVQSVLDLDPAEAVYVFAPSSVGLVVALAAAPSMIRLFGERMAALAGFLFTATSLCFLGLVDHGLATVIDPVNPFRLLASVGLHQGGPLRTASFLAVPLGFGIALTGMSVQTFINRRVPLSHQGRTFALQSTLKNAIAIGPLLLMGVAASLVGVDTVLIASPLLLVLIAVLLVRLSQPYAEAPARGIDVLASFWHDPGTPSASIET